MDYFDHAQNTNISAILPSYFYITYDSDIVDYEIINLNPWTEEIFILKTGHRVP